MKLMREPLVHFVVAGALLFGAYAWLNSGQEVAGGADRTVRITERDIDWIVETTTRQWQRAPTAEELQGLVTEYVREEMLAREARELELDRDDTIVRRRLAQKMTFFLEDTARLTEPTEDELRALYEEGGEKYRAPARSSFEQIYFSPEKRGDRAADDARRILARLAAGAAAVDPATLGDGSLLPSGLAQADAQAISGHFGSEFARAIEAFTPGSWQGPIPSDFGLHLVRVTARTEARPLPFEEVRARVVEDWRRGREAAAKEAYFAGLLRKYDVQAAENVRPLLGPAFGTLEGSAE